MVADLKRSGSSNWLLEGSNNYLLQYKKKKTPRNLVNKNDLSDCDVSQTKETKSNNKTGGFLVNTPPPQKKKKKKKKKKASNFQKTINFL